MRCCFLLAIWVAGANVCGPAVGQDAVVDAWLQPTLGGPALDPGWSETLLRGQASVFDEPLVTDRPDFTEASSTVGRGVAQLEMGYTFVYNDNESDGSILRAHNAPETLLRFGVTDLVELRLFWNYVWERTIDAGAAANPDGAEDLSVGAKIALLEEAGLIPESAVIVEFGIPTGGRAFTTDHFDVGVNFLYSWSLPNDWSLAGSTGYSTSAELASLTIPPATVSQTQDRHNVWHQSIAIGAPITERFGIYLEYFGLYTDGLASDFPAHFVDGGFTYLWDNNTQFDIRAGQGINASAEDFFGGVGLSKRF